MSPLYYCLYSIFRCFNNTYTYFLTFNVVDYQTKNTICKMKFFMALASIAGADAILRMRASTKSESAVSVKAAAKARTEALAAMKAKEMARYMDSVRAAAEASGSDDYVNDDGSDYDPDDGVVYGENGEENEIIDENPMIGVHQFVEADSDKPDPEHYEGEDEEQIDADDDETNFGEDAPEENINDDGSSMEE